MRKGVRIPEVLTPEESAVLLRQPDKRSFVGYRDFVMMRLMLNDGLRASEVLGLAWSAIDFATGQLKVVRGKGDKDRILWMRAEDLVCLTELKKKARSSDYVFTSLDGRKLSDRYLRMLIKRYGQHAGIQKDIHPHTLRHSFATDLYRETHDIRLTQRALGHENLSTTEIYTHIADSELEKALKTFRSGSQVASGSHTAAPATDPQTRYVTNAVSPNNGSAELTILLRIPKQSLDSIQKILDFVNATVADLRPV